MTLRQRLLLVDDRFTSQAPELAAFGHENLNQIALRLDGRALLDDEHGHQSVGDDEQNGEHREKTAFFLWNLNWHHRCVTEQGSQLAPRPRPTDAGTSANCSLRANNGNRWKVFNLFELAGFFELGVGD